jgi:4-aminobutyrate--pyruvate transaminase
VTALLSKDARRDIAYHVHGFTNLVTHGRTGPRIITGGDGIYIRDSEGRRYIEAAAGMWCASLGFSEESLAVAAYEQLRTLPYYHTLASRSVPPTIELAERLSELVPMDDARFLFALSGSEANDFLIKCLWYFNNARGLIRKKKVISRINGYHGATGISASLTGIQRLQQQFDLPLPGFLHTHDPHYRRHGLSGETRAEYVARILSDLETMILREGPETIMAFIAEPCTGSGGVVVPPVGYYAALQQLLEKYDILFLADEVITGFGRTGRMFGCETFGIHPAAMTMAKGLSAGYQPIAAIAMPAAIWDTIADASDRLGVFGHGTTYAGHPVAAAVALRVLDIFKERDLLAHVAGVAARFQDRLAGLARSPLVFDTRGVGLIGAVELHGPPSGHSGSRSSELKVIAEDLGLVVRALGSIDGIALSPPLIITEREVDEVFDILGDALARLESRI